MFLIFSISTLIIAMSTGDKVSSSLVDTPKKSKGANAREEGEIEEEYKSPLRRFDSKKSSSLKVDNIQDSLKTSRKRNRMTQNTDSSDDQSSNSNSSDEEAECGEKFLLPLNASVW